MALRCDICQHEVQRASFDGRTWACRHCAAVSPSPADLHLGTGTGEPGDTMAYKRYVESLAVGADGRTPVYYGKHGPSDREAPY